MKGSCSLCLQPHQNVRQALDPRLRYLTIGKPIPHPSPRSKHRTYQARNQVLGSLGYLRSDTPAAHTLCYSSIAQVLFQPYLGHARWHTVLPYHIRVPPLLASGEEPPDLWRSSVSCVPDHPQDLTHEFYLSCFLPASSALTNGSQTLLYGVSHLVMFQSSSHLC